MQERGKEDKMRGVVKKIWGGYAGEDKEDKMRGVLWKKKLRGGGMPERGKEDKIRGGGGVRKKFEGGGVFRRG